MDKEQIRDAADRIYSLTGASAGPDPLSPWQPAAPALRQLTAVLIDQEVEPDQRKAHLCRSMQKALTGLAQEPGQLLVRLWSDGQGGQHLELGFANRSGADLLSPALEGHMGAVEWASESAVAMPKLRSGGLLSGVPAVLADGEPLPPVALLDAVAAGMQGAAYALTILARPCPLERVKATEVALWDELSRNAEARQSTWQESKGTTTTTTSTEGQNWGSGAEAAVLGAKGVNKSSSEATAASTTTTEGGQRESAAHVALDQRLRTLAERCRRMAAEGAWESIIVLAASTPQLLERLGTLAAGALAGEGDAPVAPTWSIHRDALNLIQGDWPAEAKMATLMTSRELAAIAVPPARDFPGYELLPTPSFGVQPRAGSVDVGQVLDRGRAAGTQAFGLTPDDLVRHTLVAGMTGSGKTNTLFHLMGQARVPFLVIEPVKTEYRALIGLYPDLRVYTLGEERISPLRLNPFWFPPGFSLQHHLDSLKAIFTAAFSMYASMPNILEQCLYNVYIRKGWSLQHSTNVYAAGGKLGTIHYPTLEDLYDEVDHYLAASGYAGEVRDNIRSALLTRLKSLMTGGKGLLLNTTEMTLTDDFFAHPTVLELDGIPDDDEKALVIGLLVIRLYEHLKLHQQQESEALRHLLVLEEAHRVFRNVSTSNNPEVADPVGRMVALFGNMLAEIRAYGQGVIIVEQVPTKLAPDAVKNTNVKIVHRLVSGDECEYMSTALTITPEEARFASRLKRGEALVYAEGMHRPVHLRLPPAKHRVSPPAADALRKQALAYNPLLRRATPTHPLAEVILQDPQAARAPMAVAARFARNLLYDDVRHLHAAWQAGSRQIVAAAEEMGYDLDVDGRDLLALSLMRGCLRRVVAENPYVRNNLRAGAFLGVYLDRVLEFSRATYAADPGALDQLGAVRDIDLHDLLRRVYATAFRRDELGRRLALLPPSYLDGDAAMLAARWPKGAVENVFQTEPPDFSGLINGVHRLVENVFLVPPQRVEPVRLLTAKIVLLLGGERLTPEHMTRLCRHLNLATGEE